MVGIIISLLYSFSLPTLYTAETVLVDENTEMNVSVGANRIMEKMSDKDNGINDIEIYAQILESREFVKEISEVYLQGHGVTYLEHVKANHRLPWWHAGNDYNDDETATDRIRECIKHRVIASKQTLTIQVVDPDPLVSATMVDSVCTHLQQAITQRRQQFSALRQKNLSDISADAHRLFRQLQLHYATYQDAHSKAERAEEQSLSNTLKEDSHTAYTTYSILKQQDIREELKTKRSPQSFYTLKRASVPLESSNPQYLVNLLAFTFVALVLATWYVLYRYVNNKGKKIQWGNVFSPWFISIGIWAVILFFYYIYSDQLYPVKTHFYVSLVLWLLIFCSSSFITYNLLPRQYEGSKRRFVSQSFNTVVFNVLFAVSVAITPLYLYSILKIVSQFGTEEFLSNIRILAVHGNERFGYLGLSYVLNQALLIIALWRYPRIPLWKLLTVYCMTLMNAFAIMEKGMLFFVIIITLFVVYEKRLLKMRSVMMTLGSIIILFFVINLFRSSESSTNIEEASLTDFFVMYVLSPPAAFSTLCPDISLQPGSHTFHDIYRLLTKYGFGDFVVNDRAQDFVFVPISTNVYTIFQSFYEDFKYQGVAFFALVYGLFSGWMYRLYQNGNTVGKVMYTYLIYVLVLQFYQEYIFQTFIQFWQFVFFVLIVHQCFVGLSFNGHTRLYRT